VNVSLYSERHGLLLIVVLGESVIAALDLTNKHLEVTILALLFALLVKLLYFEMQGKQIEENLGTY